ncbi:MAG: glycosyltransferase [Planctomycetia bacterium]|nr:glycosyltransferase [Planctomycetia bacterium]
MSSQKAPVICCDKDPKDSGPTAKSLPIEVVSLERKARRLSRELAAVSVIRPNPFTESLNQSLDAMVTVPPKRGILGIVKGVRRRTRRIALAAWTEWRQRGLVSLAKKLKRKLRPTRPSNTLGPMPDTSAKEQSPACAKLQISERSVLESEDKVLAKILSFKPKREGKLNKPVDIIIPVYKGRGETFRCIQSVLAAKLPLDCEVIVISDCGPDHLLNNDLRKIADGGRVTLIENTSNLGFVKSVNRGMKRALDRDVILLNSDTEVFGDWIGRLARVAYKNSRIGTVTPFSNNASICSYPTFYTGSQIPENITPCEIDRICADVNCSEAVDVPTGVGYCMYIRRDCLDQVGFFNDKLFGTGYGEENDFCFRARNLGWRNLLATDTYVYHKGATSFGASKQAACDRAQKILNSLYPSHQYHVEVHLRHDPAFEYRRNIDLIRLSRQSPQGSAAILLVSHNLGGGTERHVVDLACRLESEGVRAIILRPADGGRVRLERPGIADTPNLFFSLPDEYWSFRLALRQLGIIHVHVHHTVDVPDDVLEIIHDEELPYDVTLHDYFTVCPRINLMDESNSYCGEPASTKCRVCIQRGGSPAGRNIDIDDWRAKHGTWLSRARKVFVPNEDVAIRMSRYMPNIEFTIRPHEAVYKGARPVAAPFVQDQALRVAVIGAIGPHKGSAILLECARDALRRSLPITFHVIGITDRTEELLSVGNITVTGAYDEREVFNLLEASGCHCAFFSSVVPETFCYTLSIAFLGQLLPIAFDIGAPAARIRETGFGHVIPFTTDPAEINSGLLAAYRKFASAPDASFNKQQDTIYFDLWTDYYEFPSRRSELSLA